MIYEIIRTTQWFEKPCDEAFESGSGWSIEIKTLEQLRALIKKYDKIVIDETTIEIYDDYRE